MKHQSRQSIIFTRSLYGAIFLLPLLFFTSKTEIKIEYILLATVLSLISFLGLFFFTKALEKGKASEVVIITASSYIIGEFTSIFFLGNVIKPMHWVSLFFFLISILSLEQLSIKKFEISRVTLYSFLAAFFWGTTLTLLSVPAKKIGSLPTAFITEFSVCIISIFLVKSDLKLGLFIPRKTFFIILLMSGLSVAGVSSMYFAFTKMDAYEVVGISSTTHLLSVIFSRFILKELITTRIILSAGFASLAILIMVL